MEGISAEKLTKALREGADDKLPKDVKEAAEKLTGRPSPLICMASFTIRIGHVTVAFKAGQSVTDPHVIRAIEEAHAGGERPPYRKMYESDLHSGLVR